MQAIGKSLEDTPQNCKAWNPTTRGIKAFENRVPDSFADFIIEYPAFFEHGGSVSFKYYKDAVPLTLAESDLSVFRFFVDDQLMMSDGATTSVADSDKFKTVSFDIPKGFHALKWQYTKFSDQDGLTEHWSSEIEYIRVQGSGKTTTSMCHKCAKGFS